MIKALFIPTASSAVMWWRIQNFVETAHRLGLAQFLNPLWEKDLNHPQDWQLRLTDGPHYDPLFIRQFVPAIETGCIPADAIIFQTVHQEGGIELFDAIKTKFPHIPVLTEIDDLLTSVPLYNEAYDAYDARGTEGRARALYQLRESDGLIVTTPYLKEAYSEYNKNIFVVPNSLDLKAWGKIQRKSKPGIRIGWAGGAGHEGDIEPIIPVIKNILKTHKDVKFVFVNGPAKNGLPEGLKGLPGVEHHRRWEPVLKYPRMIQDLDFDIGIAPLRDSAFNRGKSNIKWLEGAALGYPVVASNVGHFKETLTNGKDALLADTPEQFQQALEALIVNKKFRRQVASEAYQTAYKHFNIETNTKYYADVLGQVKALKSRVEVTA